MTNPEPAKGADVPRSGGWTAWTLVGTAVAGIVVATLLARWPSLTPGSSTAVLVVGLATVWAAVRGGVVEQSAQIPAKRWLPWLLLALALALWELALLLLGNNDSWPPLSLLADPFASHSAGRLFLAVLWLGSGWWLVRRSRR